MQPRDNDHIWALRMELHERGWGRDSHVVGRCHCTHSGPPRPHSSHNAFSGAFLPYHYIITLLPLRRARVCLSEALWLTSRVSLSQSKAQLFHYLCCPVSSRPSQHQPGPPTFGYTRAHALARRPVSSIRAPDSRPSRRPPRLTSTNTTI